MNLEKDLSKYANKPIFYVTLDPERALGLEDVLPNYTIICPYKSELTEKLKDVFVLEEHLKQAEVEVAVKKGTYGILSGYARSRVARQSDVVKEHIQKYYDREKSVYVFVLKNSQLIEDLCKKRGWKLLAPRAKIAEKFENKISQYKLLKDVVSYPRTIISTIKEICICDKARNSFRSAQGGDLFNPPIVLANDSPLKSRKEFFALSGLKTFVLQFNRGHSGNSTFFIKSKKDVEKLCKLYPRREVKVSEYIKGRTYTLNCLALKDGGVITGSISEQITGLKEATNNPNTTCGNDFTSPRKLSHASIEKIQEIAKNIGNVLHKNGYGGLFGIDVIIDAKSKKVYFIELNTHQPASISFEARLHRTIGKVPLLAYFIFDSMHGGDVGDPTSRIKDLPPLILPISAQQIIYRNKTSKILRSRDIGEKYRRKGLVSRMKCIKPNEEIYRKQTSSPYEGGARRG